MDNIKVTMETTVKALTSIEERMAEVARIEKKIDARIDELEERAQRVYELNGALTSAITHFESNVDTLKQLLDRIPNLEAKIDEISKVLDSMNFTDLKESLDEASNSLEKGLEKVKNVEALKSDSIKKNMLGGGKRKK